MPKVPPDLDPLYFVQALEENAVSLEIVRDDGTFVWVNPAFERLTGYTLGEAKGRTAENLLRSGAHPPEFYAEAMATIRSGRAWRGLITSRRKDGSLFESDTLVTQGRQSRPGEKHLLALRRDVTEERRTLRALRESEERFRLAAQASRDGLWDWNLAAGSFYASGRWFEIQGAKPVPADIEWYIAHVHPDDRALFRAALDAHLDGAQPTFEVEHRIASASAPPRWGLSRGLAVRNAKGAVVRVAGSLTDISDRKHAEGQMFHAATHDSLTGVPNRAHFVQQVELAIARGKRISGPSFALLFIDLRRFKQVNDAYGHAAGDALLREAARRLQEALRGGDSVARLGGDEFGVLLEGVRDPVTAGTAGARLGRMLGRPLEFEGRSLSITATVGIAIGGGKSAVDELVRAADEAMYTARADGDRGHHVAGPDAGAKSERRARLAGDLSGALRNREIRVVYQPIVDLASGRMVGAEALARWTHPKLGPIPPLEFVAIAEDMAMGPQLGRQVLETVEDQIRSWSDLQQVGDDFYVNVNVSARQLLDRSLVEQVLRARQTGALGRGRLGLEITETVLIERPDDVARTMSELQRAGVHFSLDDFGTGFSSLSHMRGFPVNSLKLDRSFVEQVAEDPVTSQIVGGLLQMATALGLRVVAEGVETREQERALRGLGLDLAQGYLYSRPVPPQELPAFSAAFH